MKIREKANVGEAERNGSTATAARTETTVAAATDVFAGNPASAVVPNAATEITAGSAGSGKLDLQVEAARINHLHEVIHGSDSENLVNAVEIGRRCVAVKDQLKGDKIWMKWVKDNLKFCSRTANNYILVFEALNAHKLKAGTLSEAYLEVGVTKGGEHRDSAGTPAPFEFHVRTTPAKLREQIEELFQDRKSMPTIVVQGKKSADRWRSLRQSTKKHKKDFLKNGGVIIVPPVDAS